MMQPSIRSSMHSPRKRFSYKKTSRVRFSYLNEKETKKGRTLLVVPCYNEALRLDTGRIREFLERTPDIELLFVDDGSNDGTAMMLEDIAREYTDRVSIHNLSANQGKAEAVRQGMLHAMEQMPAPKYVGYIDADFATAPEEILPFHELLEHREDLQGVIGVRLSLTGHRIKRELHRSILSKIFSVLASIVIGVRMRDPKCGAKLFRAGAALQSALHRPFLSKWIFDVEILSRLSLYYERNAMPPLEWAIYEYPLETWSEVGGSKFGLDDMWEAMWDLGQIFWENTWFGSRYRESTWWSWNPTRGRKRDDESAESEFDEVQAYEENEKREEDAAKKIEATSLTSVESEVEPSSIEEELAMIEETLSETNNIDESEVETEEIVEALDDIQEENQKRKDGRHNKHHKKHKHDRNRRDN
jgi:dolichyl-phosphate beta-glucosyltransferase